MSFTVGILQRGLEGNPRDPRVVTVELSGDQLQVKLVKNMKNIISINGGSVTMPQKVALAAIGQHRPVSVIEHDNDRLLVTARFAGRLRTVGIDRDGNGVLLAGWDKPIVRSRTLLSREFGR